MSQTFGRLVHRVLPQAKFWFFILIPIIAIIMAISLVITRDQPQDAIEVSLYERSEISPLQQIGTGVSGQPGEDILRVAIAGVLSPSRTLESYQELLTYMGQELGRQVTLILKPTYAEINDLIRGGRVDVAFVCSLAYAKGSEDFDMEILVVPQMYGQTVYYSYLIVPQDSRSLSLEDLRGDSFAFTDPLSNSGHLAPTYQLLLLGETPVSFFDRYIYTYSHDNSILAVADKLTGGAAVDSLVYEQLAASDPELISRTRVVARWGPYGIPPVVVNPKLDTQLKQQLESLFLGLHDSDEGSSILSSLAIDRFVVVSDGTYDSIREMKNKLGW